MASSKSKSKTALPKMFEPLLGQVQSQGALRYGAQEQGLQALLGDTTRNYQNQALAQQGGFRSLLGALKAAPAGLDQVYSDAGLTPEVRAQYAQTPDGQRILASLARGQGDIQQQQLGAQSGQQFIQQKLGSDYTSDVGKIQGQMGAERTERGVYESSLLDQLIGDNRAARSKLNADARDRQATQDAATQAQTAAQTNALIGQGLLPGSDGTLAPLPGGKADPNAPSNKPKRTTGAGTASPDAQRTAGTSFSKAAALAKALKGTQDVTPDVASSIAGILTNGKPASSGKVVYEEVPALDSRGQPIPGKTKRQPKLDPATGQQVTSNGRPAVPAFDAPIATAATEQALYGYVTTKTVRELQKLGFSVNQIPGLKTETQYKASKPKDTRDYSRPGKAKSRSQQPG